jgi:hypothetical protein
MGIFTRPSEYSFIIKPCGYGKWASLLALVLLHLLPLLLEVEWVLVVNIDIVMLVELLLEFIVQF